MNARQTVRVEVTSSYARRRGTSVAVVLHLPDVPPDTAGGVVRFTAGGHSLRSRATVGKGESGVVLDAVVAGRRISAGVWHLAVRLDGEGAFRDAQARVLIGRSQPIALLTGRARPVGLTATGANARTPSAPRRVGRVADRALGNLVSHVPGDSARRAHGHLRTLARRIVR